MAKPFDVTVKHLLEAYPGAWLAYLGLNATGPVDLIDADLATVSAEADKMMRVNDALPWLVHVELQASYDPTLGQRLLRYNVLLDSRHGLPVQSVAVLLRPTADGSALTGRVERRLPGRRRYLEFEYDVVRVWEQPVETALAGGLGTLPLAPLADVSPAALPAVIRRMDERVSREASVAEAALLWTATYLLMGLRYHPDTTKQLLQGVRAMRESSTYQAIVIEGRIEEAQTILLRQGRKRFGPPDPRTIATLEAITELGRLERLSERLLEVSNWDELLTTP